MTILTVWLRFIVQARIGTADDSLRLIRVNNKMGVLIVLKKQGLLLLQSVHFVVVYLSGQRLVSWVRLPPQQQISGNKKGRVSDSLNCRNAQ